MIFENVKVAFAQITGEGNDNGKHLIGIFVNKDNVKELKKARKAVYGKDVDEGDLKQSLDDWMETDEETGKKFLWLGCDADPANPAHALDYIVDEDDDFTMKDFAIIGTGSKVTVEFNMFKTTFKKKPNIGRALIAVQLNTLVPFEGGSTPTTLKGKKLSQDGTSKKGKGKDKESKKDKKSEKKKSKK